MRATALGLLELGDPLDHVLGGETLELGPVDLDLAGHRLPLTVDGPGFPSLSPTPCAQRGLDRLSTDHEQGPLSGPRVQGSGTMPRVTTFGRRCARDQPSQRGSTA